MMRSVLCLACAKSIGTTTVVVGILEQAPVIMAAVVEMALAPSVLLVQWHITTGVEYLCNNIGKEG
jgi:hypothetical protein